MAVGGADLSDRCDKESWGYDPLRKKRKLKHVPEYSFDIYIYTIYSFDIYIYDIVGDVLFRLAILTRICIRVQSVRDRSGMSYVSHQMTGTAPMLKRLGFRPKTANRGPGGDLAKILATDTTVHDSDRVPDAAPANRCVMPSSFSRPENPAQHVCHDKCYA
jgi:hypothetical protein